MMKINLNGPCKGCEERTEFGACHSTCEKYIGWKKQVEEYNRKVKAHKRKTADAADFIYRRVNKRDKA